MMTTDATAKMQQPRPQWTRPRKPYVIAILLLVSWWVFTRPRFDKPFQHRITVEDVRLKLPNVDFSPGRDHDGWHHSEVARKFCRGHGYEVFFPTSESGARKVYDLIMINTELDHLEIRLDTLYDYVDYFIIVEAPKTFTGKKKPMHIKNNWDMFKKYHAKMIYHELEYPDWFKPKNAWNYEYLQRDAMFDQVLPRLSGPKAPEMGDAIMVSDVDEIPRPVTALVLRTCSYPRRLTLGSKFYYYSYQFLHKGREWHHPQATYYEGPTWTIKPNNLRMGYGGIIPFREFEAGTLSNAAWHCSSCFSTMAEFKNKMGSFSHTWMNKKKYRDEERIAEHIREGRDVWDRKRDQFTRIEGNLDLPPILKHGDDKDKERFRYMLNRDGPSAGFTDWPKKEE